MTIINPSAAQDVYAIPVKTFNSQHLIDREDIAKDRDGLADCRSTRGYQRSMAIRYRAQLKVAFGLSATAGVSFTAVNERISTAPIKAPLQHQQPRRLVHARPG